MNTKLEELKAKMAEIQKEIEKLKKDESKYLDLSVNAGWEIGEKWKKCDFHTIFFQIRTYGEYTNKGFYLNESILNWEIVRDDDNYLVLLPTKK